MKRRRVEPTQLNLDFPFPPPRPEWEQCVLPNVSLARDPIEPFKTSAGFFLYGLGGIVRELVALKLNIRGPQTQTVTVRGETFHCFIVVPPNGNHPGWVNARPSFPSPR